jgi:hypothetical protein
LGLSHHFISPHDRLGGKKPQQADLRESAEANARCHTNFFEPCSRDVVVNMPSVGKGDPDIHIREKE